MSSQLQAARGRDRLAMLPALNGQQYSNLMALTLHRRPGELSPRQDDKRHVKILVWEARKSRLLWTEGEIPSIGRPDLTGMPMEINECQYPRTQAQPAAAQIIPSYPACATA